MNPWQPITQSELETLVTKELGECSSELKAIFEQFRVPFFSGPILRYDNLESVFIVAKKGNEVLYYEDVEEGFNFSPVSSEGVILEHWCNQDELKTALLHWAV